MPTMQALPTDHPEMKAWEEYKNSDEYKNSFNHAAQEQHRDGSMWAAFDEGWRSATILSVDDIAGKVQKQLDALGAPIALTRDQRDALCAANAFLTELQKDRDDTHYFYRVQKVVNIISDMLYGKKPQTS